MKEKIIKDSKQKLISIVVYTILFSIIIVLSSFLIWSLYINDLYKEYKSPYDEKCYKVEFDDSSITITTYTNYGRDLYKIEKMNFENGKYINFDIIEVYKTKNAAKTVYENKLRNQSWIITNLKLDKNVISYTNSGDVTYVTKEIQEKVDSCTTNEEIIKYLLDLDKTNNFGMPEEYKRID